MVSFTPVGSEVNGAHESGAHSAARAALLKAVKLKVDLGVERLSFDIAGLAVATRHRL
jgi:hypothetical protein